MSEPDDDRPDHFHRSIADPEAGGTVTIKTEAPRSSLATLVAASAARLAQISAESRYQKRLERLEVAARTLGADRRMGPRMPHNGTVEIVIDGHTFLTNTIDIGHHGMMLERPQALASLNSIRCLIDLDQIGQLTGRIVALDRETLCIALDDVRAAGTARRLALLLANLAHQNAAALEAASSFAQAISRAFTNEVEQRRISLTGLFSADLRKVEGSNPAQFDHPADAIFNEVLPPIIARYYQPENNIAYAVATDRNGYVPVHQPAFSQAQRRSDLLFNHKFARNKRVYDDRWTWRAARFAPGPIVQACRRDIPRGFGALVSEASAPLFVSNKRWGAAQIGFSLDLEG